MSRDKIWASDLVKVTFIMSSVEWVLVEYLQKNNIPENRRVGSTLSGHLRMKGDEFKILRMSLVLYGCPLVACIIS